MDKNSSELGMIKFKKDTAMKRTIEKKGQDRFMDFHTLVHLAQD